MRCDGAGGGDILFSGSENTLSFVMAPVEQCLAETHISNVRSYIYVFQYL